MLLGEKIRARQARDDVTALVDFLKHHPPPPDNFMSIPYEGEEDDNRGRWSKIKSMAKRSKSMPREPQRIRLPDSAVAGVTIGGHRHISISIPWEATPFGEDMRSQYPVFNHDMQVGTPSKESIRTYKNEKGVVTVLRPVTEVQEADHGSTASKCRSPPYANSHGLRPPPLPPHKPTSSAGSPPHDYIGVLPTRFDTPLLDDSSAPWHIPRAPSRGEGKVQTKQDQQLFQRATHPARASSMGAGRAARDRNPPSIDGVMQHQKPLPNVPVPIVSRGRYFSDSHDVERQGMATNNNEVKGKAHQLGHERSNTSSSLYSQDIRPVSNRNGSHNCNPTASMENKKGDSCPPTPSSTRSRKDIVRERKRRDIEAMRQTQAKEQHEPIKVERETAQQASTKHASTLAGEGLESARTQLGSTLTLSNLMVVMDMEPTAIPQPEMPPGLETRPSVSCAKKQAESQSPVQWITVNEPTMPTPPTSPSGSPPQKQRASDRTLLTRRRERKATRDQESKAREAMNVVKATAQQLASGEVTHEDGVVPQADKDALRLYEAYREHRLRDMERRLRRLERNGDVWLQALVPVLDNMNRTLAAAHNQPLGDMRDWASDGETPAGADRASRDMQKRKLTRRSSLSQGRLLEKLAGERYSDDAWSDSVSRSDDASGFGTIEPLMRELAGESRRWQGMTTQSPVVTNEQF
ncbi:hypothetical protein EsDP_00005348 [Epichloe bromicola]|uniref:Uncharacterized protein n=1 Tax=Epichloe bromicola TaxID=79588 RepID=A0ABQ0CUH9_9HYPO